MSHEPAKSTPSQPARPGDLHLQGHASGRFAYRPATDTVFRKTRFAWDGPRGTWYVDNSARICALGSRPAADGLLRASTDEGRTFTAVSLAGVLPADAGPRVHACDTTSQRVVVGTGGEEPLAVHTLDRAGTRLLSSQALGGQLDPYNWNTLPDGRLVTGTNRGRGVMVATDPTNQVMAYRPTPAPMVPWFDIVGDEFVLISRGYAHVSRDAGLTWQRFDLQLP